MCKCGRLKSLHDASMAREDTSEQWTPERCTRKLPTDAYGEIEFLGQGSQTKRSPVSIFLCDTHANTLFKGSQIISVDCLMSSCTLRVDSNLKGLRMFIREFELSNDPDKNF